MPRMTQEVAEAVMALSKESRFVTILRYFESIEKEIQEQINMPSTPKDEREILVHINQRLRDDVIRVIHVAEDLLKRKEIVKSARASAR